MWFLLALIGAACTTGADVFTKKAAARLPEYVLAMAVCLYSLPVLFVLMPLTPMHPPPGEFWSVILTMIPIELIALFLYIRAITTAPLSLSVPFLSFTPMFLILTGALFLGEVLPLAGVAGVLLVAAGAYCMNIGDIKKGLLSPFLAIFRLRGPRLALVTAILYAVTSALAKKAILLSHPYLYTIVYMLCLTVVLGAALLITGRSLSPVFSNWKVLLPIGALLGTAAIAMNLAFIMAPVAYAIAVKRLSLVFGVFAGRIIFGEGGFAERFVGASLMLGGVAILALVK